MSSAGSILLLSTSILIAGFAAVLCNKLIGTEFRRSHHDVGSVVFLQLGVMFAVLLAFVFSEVWSEYDEAAKSINLEVSAMHGVAILAATLPPHDAKTILTAEKAYLVSVIDDEWPFLAGSRREESQTRARFTGLIQNAANLRLSDADERDKKNAILSLLADAHKQRETRLYQAQNGIPAPLWYVLIGYTVVLAIFVAFSAIDYAFTTVAIAACFTAGTTSILIMARLFDYPFEGALGLPPTDFSRLVEKIAALMNQSSAT